MSSVDLLERKAGTQFEEAAASLVLLRASNHLFRGPCYERSWNWGDQLAVRILDQLRTALGFPAPRIGVER